MHVIAGESECGYYAVNSGRRSFAEKRGIRGKEDDNGLIKKLSSCNGLSLICLPGPCMDLFSL